MSDAPSTRADDPEQRRRAAERSVRRASLAVLVLIVLSLVWYLAADRYTPYTQQARVQAFVVGIAPQVGGIITRVWVHNNQPVHEGDPLFQIDRQPYQIAVARAEAVLDKARSALAAAKSGIEVAQAGLDAAKANADKARKDAERQRRLHRRDPGAISLRRVETAEANWRAAHARVASARAKLERAREQEAAAREQLEVARAGLEKARLDLQRTLVRAPSDGVVTDLRADTGHYAATGQPAMTLVALHNLWIEAHYTENNLGHLEPGTPVEVVLDALPGRVFSGRVEGIGLGVSSSKPVAPGNLPSIQNSRDWLRQAQRFPVQIVLDPQQEGLHPEQLRVGGQAEVIAYTEPAWLLRPLAWLYIRFMSLLSYAY